MGLIDAKKAFILDLDGTIYLSDTPIKGAREFVKRLYDSGKRVVYFTNNASKNASLYYDKLTRLGFPVRHEDIVTSGDVTADFLVTHRANKSVYLLGTPALYDNFSSKGVKLVSGDKKADIVVSSFDLTLTYEKLEKACTLIREGAEFISTHPDINCPTIDGFIPDSGAICQLITASTGVLPKYLGKPHAETVEYIEKHTGLKREDMVIVGDRVYTDIALGVNNGMCAAFVLSGEGTVEQLKEHNLKPDYIFDSVAQIF